MGSFLSIPHKLHYDLISELSGNAFIIYSLFLKCVTFKTGTQRQPANGTDFFVYPFSKAKKCGYSHNKTQFSRGIKELIKFEYIEIIRAGHFQGYSGFKQQNLYRLLRF